MTKVKTSSGIIKISIMLLIGILSILYHKELGILASGYLVGYGVSLFIQWIPLNRKKKKLEEY